MADEMITAWFIIKKSGVAKMFWSEANALAEKQATDRLYKATIAEWVEVQ